MIIFDNYKDCGCCPECDKDNKRKVRIIPLLPLRGLLVYPTMVLHLDVGREKSVQALGKGDAGRSSHIFNDAKRNSDR